MKIPLESIVDLYKHFYYYKNLSYTHEVWAAVYIMNGGCSDDCFSYFRNWLIFQGKQVFMKALKDPDS